MGIYPTYRKSAPQFNHHTGVQTWTEYKDTPGLIESREVTATRWEESSRTNCYCCSCAEREGSDPYCRNHNFGFGMRPCETHKMPGETIEDPEGNDSGEFPMSVQAKWKQRAEA